MLIEPIAFIPRDSMMSKLPSDLRRREPLFNVSEIVFIAEAAAPAMTAAALSSCLAAGLHDIMKRESGPDGAFRGKRRDGERDHIKTRYMKPARLPHRQRNRTPGMPTTGHGPASVTNAAQS